MPAGELAPLGPSKPWRRIEKTPADAPQSEPTVSRDIELLAHWSDTIFRIPGLNIRIGLDALLGLIPGVGDVTSAVASLYILAAANRYQVPRITLMRMALNVFLDTLIGSLPLVGDLFDVFWKSNQRNVELLRRHLAAGPQGERTLQRRDRWFVVAVLVTLAALMVAAAVATFYILAWVIALIGNLFR